MLKVQNDFKKELQMTHGNLDASKGAINSTTGQVEFNPDMVLDVVNQNRIILGAEPITKLSSIELKVNIKLPTAATTEQNINVTLLERDVINIKEVLSAQSIENVSKIDSTLRNLIVEVKSNPGL